MNKDMSLVIPLFPLKTVLFPGGVLPLRIFEPRYLDMISRCLKEESGIGVVLISDGSEIGRAAETHEVGTSSLIDYWHKRRDGLLGVTLAGQQRFKILSREVQSNQLIVAEVVLLPEVEPLLLSEEHQHLVDVLQNIISQLSAPYSRLPLGYENANWVSSRLAELLPISLADKQRILLLDDAQARLETINELLHKLEY